MTKINEGNFIGGADLKSFLMIGQSNMAGRGNFADVKPIDNYKCYMLRNGRFLRMSEPINPDRAIFGAGYTSGIGLSASFADELSKSQNCRVGLIPCADGGTTISEWQKGGVLYDNAVQTTKLAMRSSTLSGIIWHQGESDCVDDQLYRAYKPKFIQFVKDIRADLGGNLPFIAGELPYNLAQKWGMSERAHEFNVMLNSLCEEISNFTVVSASGLTLKDDGLHFNSVSLREFGKRYYTAYEKLTKK